MEHQGTSRIQRIAPLLLLLLAILPPARALDPGKAFSQYALSTWAHDRGLPADSVMAVTQTVDGFLWLATEQGLVRFDGKRIQNFDEETSPALGDRFIRSLAADPDGSLWIGTMSGIVRYRAGQFENLRQQTRSRIDIFDLVADGEGGVWYSSDNGLHHYGRQGYRLYTTADGLPSNAITGLTRSADGALWVGTADGLAEWKGGGRFQAYTDWAEGRRSPVNTLSVGAHGTVWVGLLDGTLGRLAEGRIATWSTGGKTQGKPIECIHEDTDGTLWLAVKRVGLIRIRGGRGPGVGSDTAEVLGPRDGLPSSNPDWIFEDRERSLWVGWADAGLSQVRDTRFTTFGKAEGLSSNLVTSVLPAQGGGLWIGTNDVGLNRLRDGKVTQITHANGLGDDQVLGLLQQRDGTLWIGSEGGKVTRLAHGRLTVLPVTSKLTPGIPAMVEDRANTVWVGMDMPFGLSRFAGDRFAQEGIEGRVRALAVAPDGSLWVAAYRRGLIRIKGGATQLLTEADGLPSLALTSLYVARDGSVWVGTRLSGVARWKAGQITRYSEKIGLFDDAVGAVEEDDQGYLWMAGTRGIWRVHQTELDAFAEGRIPAIHCESYGYADGLRSLNTSLVAQPAIARDAAGRLWFATTGGVSMVDPAHLLRNTVTPHPAIESVLFDGRQAAGIGAGPRGAALRSPPGAQMVEAIWTAPSFVVPDAMRFRYRLGNGPWVDAGTSRSATFERLKPGVYRLEVQAANSDGCWSPESAAVEFRLRAHVYETGWFRLLAALCLFVLVRWAYAARVRLLIHRTQKLEETVASRTAEVRAALQNAEQARELLRDQATRDGLTGLWNRRTVFDILERELTRCRSTGSPLCLLMVDADHFKSINDTYGHLAGDSVIQCIAGQLRGGLRHNEAIGRYGGEELLVVLPHCPLTTALLRADELRVQIEQQVILHEGREIRITCSFGVAESGPGGTIAELVGAADNALYAAKRAGRNCVRPQLTCTSCPKSVQEIAAESPVAN